MPHWACRLPSIGGGADTANALPPRSRGLRPCPMTPCRYSGLEGVTCTACLGRIPKVLFPTRLLFQLCPLSLTSTLARLHFNSHPQGAPHLRDTVRASYVKSIEISAVRPVGPGARLDADPGAQDPPPRATTGPCGSARREAGTESGRGGSSYPSGGPKT